MNLQGIHYPDDDDFRRQCMQDPCLVYDIAGNAFEADCCSAVWLTGMVFFGHCEQLYRLSGDGDEARYVLLDAKKTRDELAPSRFCHRLNDRMLYYETPAAGGRNGRVVKNVAAREIATDGELMVSTAGGWISWTAAGRERYTDDHRRAMEGYARGS